MNNKKLTLHEKWSKDTDSYEKGAKIRTSYPQCESCSHYIKGDALNCKKYIDERKPKGVLFAHTECMYYNSIDPLKLDITSEKQNRFFGGVFGFCVGDMLGVPVEFSSRQEREADPVRELRAYGTYHQPFGSWSDDSSFMFCLMDALMSEDVLEQLKNNMIACYKEGLFTPRGQMFDIGNSTRYAIENMERGIPAVECGGSSQQDNGNGSLMRILPLAYLIGKRKDEEVIKLIEDVSSLTHRHMRSKFACVFYVIFASQLYNGVGKEDAFDYTLEFVHKHCAKEYHEEFFYYKNVLNKSIIKANRNQINSTGYVVDTMEAVIWTFFNTGSYEKSVLEAINLGGDTDTIAALVGGLSGLYYGYKEIPDRWVQNILRKNEIAEMCRGFELFA